MNVAVMKTKAELALAEQFEAVAEGLPGRGWPLQARRAALRHFVARGLPHRRIEDWKYTDLRAATKEAYPPAASDKAGIEPAAVGRALGPALDAVKAVLIVFLNGRFIRVQARTGEPKPGQWHFDPLSLVLGAPGFDWMQPHLEPSGEIGGEAMVALNAAFVTDGAVLRVDDGAKPALPIHLVFVSDGSEPCRVTTRNLISIGENAEVTLIESHVSLGSARRQSNSVTEIRLHDGARVSHIKVLAEGAGAAHVANCSVSLGARAAYDSFQLTTDIGLARNQMLVTFKGPRSRIDLSGAFIGDGRQHIDTTLVVDHAVPECSSRELFKGVLAGTARGVFQGKIIVRPDAQKTDGKQMAQGLLLSESAEFDSKPELEIFADDVVCGHGSTSAELDPELVFYLRSRGIPQPQARALLVEAFVAEAIDKVEHEGLREALMAKARDRLAAVSASTQPEPDEG